MYVSLNPEGKIVMSRITWERFGKPAAVRVRFDEASRSIALKPADPMEENAFRLGPHGSAGGKVIRAYPTMQQFRIELAETVRFYDVSVDHEGQMILDLRTARVSPSVSTHIRNRTKTKVRIKGEQ